MTATLTHDKAHAETRARIIDAAGEVFARTGFEKATVREICSLAQANVAAVNYHFGDKLGLYTEVLKTAACAGRTVLDEASTFGDPEGALGHYIHGMFQNMRGADRPAWFARVMLHELVQPTEALDVVVEQMIRPNSRILCSIVGKILNRPPEDELTRLSAASVIGQVIHHVHAKPVISKLWPEIGAAAGNTSKIADHITGFSLAAMRSLRQPNAPAKHFVRRSK